MNGRRFPPRTPIRRIVLGALTMGVLWCALSPQAGWAGRVRPVDRVKIAVDEKVLTENEVNEIRQVRISEMKSRLKGKDLDEGLRILDKNLHEQLIEELLLESHAERLKIEISDKVLEERMDTILRRDPTMERNYTQDQIKGFILKDMLRRQVLGREVDSQIYISEVEIRAACRRQAGNTREVEVGHILIRSGESNPVQRLLDIRQMLVDGARFEEMALANSQDPSVKDNKGRLGFIGRGQFVKPFEEAAFALPVGDLSEPVKSRLGYHLIKVFAERAKTGVDCENLDEVNRRGLRNQIYAQQRRERMDTFFARLRKTASIRVLD